MCEIGPLATSGCEVLEVSAGNQTIVLEDVAVGEVFVVAGQSNAEFWMRYEKYLAEALPSCDDPLLRFFDVPKRSYPGQEHDFDYSRVERWRKSTPEDLEFFSALGYYFGRELRSELGVPVGLVGCNYGGTQSLAWMSAEHARVVQPEQTAAFEAKLQGLSYEELLAHASANPKNDKGYATWPAWNEFFLPRTPTDEEIRIFMELEAATAGPADVGGLTLEGHSGEGDPKGQEPHPGLLASTKHAPGSLFEHMVLRLAPFSVRGVLWHQGESDDEVDGAQARHAHALQTIMADWRAAWGCPSPPFFVVQLPGFGSWMGFGAKDWATIRHGQQEATDQDFAGLGPRHAVRGHKSARGNPCGARPRFIGMDARARAVQ